MTIVVLNVGSGSLRCSLFILEGEVPSAAEPREPDWEAAVDSSAPGQPLGRHRVAVRRAGAPDSDGGLIDSRLAPRDRALALLRLLWTGPEAPLPGPDAVDVVGHRIVHGGACFDRAARIDAEVESVIAAWAPAAPQHNPPALDGIRAARDVFGEGAADVAVFDTAFHRTLPEAAAVYPGPHQWREEGIRRYGFHGTNFRWVAERSAHLLGRPGDPALRLVLCHLGSGCSLCATRGGHSVDTTMGFTPLDGIAMSTRPGALDPGILLHLLRRGTTPAELEELLERGSGLKGLSEISGDTRELRPKAEAGNLHARLALDVFVHRLRAGIGQMIAALGDRPDAIVFTDAIAEDEPELRAAACEPFAFLGLHLDLEKNRGARPDMDLSTGASPVRALLVGSREAWQIARECRGLLVRNLPKGALQPRGQWVRTP